MKKLVSIFLTLTLLMSLFSMVDVSAVTNEKYLVDLIAEGNATVGDLANYTPYQCDSAVKGGHTSEGVVRIGDGTETGYTDYSKGFRYHSASGGSARTITFAMPEGYNTISGIVGVCYHVPGVDSGNETHYCEECYVTITVNSASIYNSGAIKVKQGYPFKVRAREGSNVIISVINPTSNGSYNHVIFGDPKLSYEDYPDIDLSFDKPVYLAGETATPVITGSEADNYTIKWYLDGVELPEFTDSYPVKKSDLGKTLKMVACDKEGIVITTAERYLSKLTVVSVETETGQDVTSKEDYIDANLKIYGNEEFGGETQYSGLTEIRGRGNTSWGFPKKSYKLKLDKKTNLCGMGKNKHWTLISCYWDENFLRNKMSYDLAGEMGLNYASSVWVDVYLNGNYHGVYLLCEHIRVDDDRVEIYDWEGTAEDVAEAIYDANPDKISDDGDFADYMNENMSWITSGEVTYEGNTYKVSDYFEDEIPDIDGGYLLELDTHRDEVSSVQTYSGLNINIKNPEFCISNPTMTNYVKDYLQAVENACISKDYTTTYNGKTVRYTDLCDLDSMVKWWMVNEVFFNWDAGYNSNFMYKDHGTKLMFGPVWDMDITAGGYGTSYLYDQWQTWYYKRSSCMNLWFKEAVADPVFLSYAHEVYWQYRDKFEEMIAEDGYMEKSHDLLYESGLKNTELWRWRKGYETDYQIMKEWLQNRLDWLDDQFATEESLIASMAAQTSAKDVTSYSSIEAYQNSAQMSVSFSTKSGAAFLKDDTNAAAKYAVQLPETLVNSVEITNNEIVTVKREINGNNPVSVNVANGLSEFADIKESDLDNGGQKSVILYTGYSANGDVLGKTYVTVDPVKCTHVGTATQQIPEKAPTCTEDGYTAGVKCSHCGMTISGLEKQPATGHVGDTVCSVCGVTIGGEITPNPDFNDSISLESVNSCKDPAIKMTFKIPEGQSGIKGIYFMMLPTENAPAGMEIANITSPLTEKGWNFEFDMQRYTMGIVAGENARPLEEIATPDANGNYHIATSILKVSNTVTSGKITVNLILANVITNSGNNEINYTKSLDINYDFSHKLEVIPEVKATCTSVGYTAGSKCTVCKKVIVEPKETGPVPHKEVTLAAKAATCTSLGITEGKQCTVCNTITVAQKNISKLPHNSRTILPAKAATYTSTGLTEGKKCSMCGTLILAQRVTPKLERKSLKKAKFTLKAKTYTGKALTQSFKVKLGSKTLKNKIDYTISYKNNKNIGKATVTIKGIGAFEGSVSKTFAINPKKLSGLKVKAGKKQMTVSFKKDSKVGGYEIVYATSKNFKKAKKTVKITKAKTVKKVISKLKSKKTYYVKVRAFKKVSGKTYYGAYTSVKKIKIK